MATGVRIIRHYLAILTVIGGLAQCAGSEKPNIIFVLTDDLGYSDLSCYGAEKVRTPHLDKLAAEGIKFSSFYTAASICSPSRAAFLTGGYPQRAGLYMGINPIRDAHWFLGLHPDEITLAEQCKSQGYDTFMVGKWHLGTEPEFLPTQQGFDHYYGMPCNFAHTPKFFDDEKLVFAKTPLDQLTRLYADRVTQIIHECGKSKKPFFLYYAHNYPHTPFRAGPKFAGTSKDGVRGDVIQELDWSIGEMMRALDQAGIEENTLIIFTSDNGPTGNRYARPFRGTKYVTLEGGHRVPFILHWPRVIKRGQVSSTNITAMDVFPTIAEVIGTKVPTDRTYDGRSLVPLLQGKALPRTDTEPFYYYNGENLQAIRRGPWKLHLPRQQEQIPFWDKNKAFANLKRPVLYNLRVDQAETINVADDNSEIVKELLELASAARQQLGDYMMPGSAQRATGSICSSCPVISHPKDWEQISPKVEARIDAERSKRHPDWSPRSRKKRRRP